MNVLARFGAAVRRLPSSVESARDVPRAVVIAWVVLLVAGTAFVDVLVYSKTLEDAFITFRYADHFAAGYGFAIWNRGEAPVEGFSSLFWMVFLAAAKWLSFNTEAVAKISGLCCHAALTALLAGTPWLARRFDCEEPWLRDPWGAPAVAALLSVSSASTAWYATNGMEAIPFALSATAAFLSLYFARRPLWPALLFGVLVLMRPEGLVIAAAIGIFHGFVRTPRQRSAIICLVVAAGVFVALTLGRLAYFGYPLPNTYYAKVSDGPPGMHLQNGQAYTFGWIRAHWIWLLAIAGGLAMLGWRRRDAYTLRILASLSLGICAYAAYITKVGGDNPWTFAMWRHFVHIAPFIWIAIGIAVSALSRGVWVRAGLALLLAWAAARNEMASHPSPLKNGLAWHMHHFPPDITGSPRGALHVWIKAISDSRDVIASASAGLLPYSVDAVHIDMLGLCDAYIAHHGRFDPKGPVDSKSDAEYVLGRRPDIIDGYVSGKRIRLGRPRREIVRSRPSLVVPMFDNPIFKNEYCFVRNAPYQAEDRAIFMRMSYVHADPRRKQIECVPVQETALYREPKSKRRRR